MNGKNSIDLTLREIADWQLNPDRSKTEGGVYAEVPSFQRGLVWNAAQIEVLWDSLLRGIPIGSLSLLPIEESTSCYTKGAEVTRIGYWILDGQQRSNAITLGFADFPSDKENPHALLWIDLLPPDELKKKSNRKYFFYVTTEGRPWGYVISDANGENRSNKVAPNVYRVALEGQNKNIRPPVRALWPVTATLPIPFALFRRWIARADDTDILCFVENHADEFTGLGWYENFKRTLERDAIAKRLNDVVVNARDIAQAVRRSEQTHVLAMVAPKELSLDAASTGKSEDELERDSEIAVYFARLNRGGTLPSQEDLNYSILKSANPALGKIDTLAGKRMHPSRLAQLAMRAYRSLERGTFVRSVSRRDAFKLGADPHFARFVSGTDTDEASPFAKALAQVDSWLKQTEDFELGLPSVVLTTIARNNPNLYLMQILWAELCLENQDASRLVRDPNRQVALVTLLAWFGDDAKLDYASLFAALRKATLVDESVIPTWLYGQIRSGTLVVPPILDFLNRVEGILGSDRCDMQELRRLMNGSEFSAGLNRLWGWTTEAGRGLLLYACHKYLNLTFGDYDPASAVWSEDARPWDYDHIIPQNWLITGQGRPQGRHHALVGRFLNSIGNLAPIPFGQNRSKHDDPPVDYLDDVAVRALIFFDEQNYDLPFFKQRPAKCLEYDDISAFRFACVVMRRFIRIYEEWLKLPVFQWLDFKLARDPYAELVKNVKEKCLAVGAAKIRAVYVRPDGTQADALEAWDRARPNLSVGAEAEFTHPKLGAVQAFVCVEIQERRFGVGIRRHPEDDGSKGGDGWWWNNRLRWCDNRDDALAEFIRVLADPSVRLIK